MSPLRVVGGGGDGGNGQIKNVITAVSAAVTNLQIAEPQKPHQLLAISPVVCCCLRQWTTIGAHAKPTRLEAHPDLFVRRRAIPYAQVAGAS